MQSVEPVFLGMGEDAGAVVEEEGEDDEEGKEEGDESSEEHGFEVGIELSADFEDVG